MRFDNLDDWLAWQETLNPAEIDLGLERVSEVLSRAKLSPSFNCPLITVGGTNGKGSVVAMLEAIAMAAGLKVCSYTSPHIFHYNERIKVNGQAVSDADLCEAFARVDEARGGIPLTYFEFGTLAAIDHFFGQQPDLVILEVGLGGRLDAVNVMDADISVLTGIAIDHIDWLGDDRESIGYEKAGIFRPGKTVICGDASPPGSVIRHARELQCKFIQSGRDFNVVAGSDAAGGESACWTLESCYGDIVCLPQPSLSGEFQKYNAATAVLAMQCILDKGLLPLQPAYLGRVVKTALRNVSLPGRFQKIAEQPQVFVDVAHNPQAALMLDLQLKTRSRGNHCKTWAVVAMLSDKDIAGVIRNVSSVDVWCFAGLEDIPRGSCVEGLVRQFPVSSELIGSNTFHESGRGLTGHDLMINQCKILSDNLVIANTVSDACACVLSKANENDRVIIFGSFYTVSKAMQFIAGPGAGMVKQSSVGSLS